MFCFFIFITYQNHANPILNIKMYRLQITKEIKKNGIRKFMVMNLSFSNYSLVVNFYVWYRFWYQNGCQYKI